MKKWLEMAQNAALRVVVEERGSLDDALPKIGYAVAGIVVVGILIVVARNSLPGWVQQIWNSIASNL